MSFFKWDPEQLSVKVSEMDAEHKILIDKMNALYDANEAKSDFNQLKVLMDDLAGYCIKHFQDEEAYMEKISFPSLEGHKLIHKDLLRQFTSHKEKFEASKDFIQKDVFMFLKFWLQSHICGVDTKYGEHAQSKAS